MSDDELKALMNARTPAPSDAARRRALDAALLAFDAEQKKSSDAAQGKGLGARLRSIVPLVMRDWTMNTRIGLGLGTAAVALLLLPLGYQLYTSTAITPLPRTIEAPVTQPETIEPAKPVADQPVELKDEEADDADLTVAEPAPMVANDENIDG